MEISKSLEDKVEQIASAISSVSKKVENLCDKNERTKKAGKGLRRLTDAVSQWMNDHPKTTLLVGSVGAFVMIGGAIQAVTGYPVFGATLAVLKIGAVMSMNVLATACVLASLALPILGVMVLGAGLYVIINAAEEDRARAALKLSA